MMKVFEPFWSDGADASVEAKRQRSHVMMTELESFGTESPVETLMSPIRLDVVVSSLDRRYPSPGKEVKISLIGTCQLEREMRAVALGGRMKKGEKKIELRLRM